jgi:hypothetical protein
MSMSLYAWKAPLVTDPDEAKRLLELEDESVFEPSEDVTRFFEKLMQRLPLRNRSATRSSPPARRRGQMGSRRPTGWSR